MEVLKFVANGQYPQDTEEFKKLCLKKKSWVQLSKDLKRPYISIANRWRFFIEPTLLSHFYGMLKFNWKKEFFQFVVDSKALSARDIDWKKACEKFPYCCKGNLQRSLRDFYDGKKGTRGTPLHKVIEPLVKGADFPNSYFQRRLDFVEAYKNMLHQNKVLSGKSKSEI